MSALRADLALVARGLMESRAQAQAAIAAGLVTVDGRTVRKPSESITEDAALDAQKPHPYVSRGGLKLVAALDTAVVSPSGLTCLDVGASTGGFTDVLLQRGAAHVVAVDTGRQQLHGRLRADERVTSLEGTDIRRLEPASLPAQPELIVIDVSFISLRLILPAVTALAAPRAHLVTLVKPQFEVGKALIGKGGIVRDQEAARMACDGIAQALAEAGWRVSHRLDSPIAGGDGNREFLLVAERG